MSASFNSPKCSLAILTIALLQVGCSSGGNSSSATPVANVPVGLTAVTSFAPSTDSVAPLATSSSGLKNQDISTALTGGGNFSTTSALLGITGKDLLNEEGHIEGFYESENTFTPNADIELQFAEDGSFSMVSNGTTYTGSQDDFELYGNYGALVVGSLADVIENSVRTERQEVAFIGIKTDSENIPTEGTATYVAKESLGQFSFAGYSGLDSDGKDFSYDSEYSSDTSNPIDDNGDFVTTLNADFAAATVSGSAQGNISDSSLNADAIVTRLDIAADITFDATSIANSDFSGTGTADLDGKVIPLNYGGSLYGPNAEEASVIYSGTHSDGTILNGGAYLLAQ